MKHYSDDVDVDFDEKKNSGKMIFLVWKRKRVRKRNMCSHLSRLPLWSLVSTHASKLNFSLICPCTHSMC